MGMYSYFVEQDIEVTMKEGLEVLKEHPENSDLITRELDIDFSAWDGHKIYGYFYKNTVLFLEVLAKHIKGSVEFNYEGLLVFRLVFSDGECSLQAQESIDWDRIDLMPLPKRD